MMRGLVLALAGAGAIRLGLAFWRGSDRLEALLITLTSIAIGVGYVIVFRSGK
jgi:hypothetical protein